jgi:predicted small secreted protein
MKHPLVLAALVLAACSSNNTVIGSGQFVAPTGLAVVPAADRDLIFVAGTGRDGLRALEICEKVDSNGNVFTNCNEDLQFVPGPIRVFPANVETDNRPVRLAGAWLDGPAPGGAPGTTPQGAVLVVGADKTVRIVDAQNLLDAEQGAKVRAPLELDIDGVAADVVTDNAVDQDTDTLTTSSSVTAFIATVPGSGPGELIEFTVARNAAGTLTPPDPSTVRRCTLDGVVASRLALAPRETPPGQAASCATTPASCIFPPTPAPTDDIFVADGAGDGVVRVARASLAAATGAVASPPCSMTRISAGGRPVRSIALSPQWYETVTLPGVATPSAPATAEAVTVNHPAGELLLMVLEPSDTPRPGLPFDSGGVLFVDLCTYSPAVAEGDNPHCKDFTGNAIVPIPPFRYDGLSAGVVDGAAAPPQAMEPISPGGLAYDATFLRAFRPDALSSIACPTGACTAVYVAQANPAQQNFFLLAAVTSSDGGTYFLDVVHRRFVNGTFFTLANNNIALEPLLTVAPTLSPAVSTSATPPTFIFAQPDDTHPQVGWFHPGVTHTANWRAVWHGTFPGLDRRGGTVTPSGRGTMFYDGPGDYAAAQADPVLHFGIGDNVGFLVYIQGSDGSAACQTLISTESLAPLRFEAAVVAINPDGAHPGRLELAGQQAVGFNPNDACTSFGVIAEFHTGGAKPWIVYDNFSAVARIGQNELFVAHEPRFDYPFDYSTVTNSTNPAAPSLPVAATDEAVAFTLVGDEPTAPGSQFSFSLISTLAPLLYGDSSIASGFATGVVSYSSPANPNALFTAVTGANSVIMATPGILNANFNGLRAFR